MEHERNKMLNKNLIASLAISLSLGGVALISIPQSTFAQFEARIVRGDCDANGVFNNTDLSNIAAEIFDDDGNLAKDAPKGSFKGSAFGCDANKDKLIDAGDIACASLLLQGEKCQKNDK